MGEHPNSLKKKKIIKKLKDKKTAIIVAVFLIALAVTIALLVYIKIQADSKPTVVTGPALQVGETKMTKEQYAGLIKEAKDRDVNEKVAEVTLQESLRAKETARKLKITVPDYLIAAQAQNVVDGIYIPYESLAEYEKITLYPKALNVLVALIESGGSLNIVLHAPYDTATNGEANRQYAESMAKDVKLYKEKAVDKDNKSIQGSVPLSLASFTTDEKGRYAPGVNKSRVAALTDDGREIVAGDEYTVENAGIESKPFAPNIFIIVNPLKKGELSSVSKLADQNAYIVVNKSDVYTKDPDIRSKLNSILQGLPG